MAPQYAPLAGNDGRPVGWQRLFTALSP